MHPARRERKFVKRARGARALIDVTSTSILVRFGDKSPPTYNRLVSIIRSAMNLAAVRGWIESAPKFARRKVVEPDPRCLTRKGWLKLRNELPDHVRTMADFDCNRSSLGQRVKAHLGPRRSAEPANMECRQSGGVPEPNGHSPFCGRNSGPKARSRQTRGIRSFGAESPLEARKDPGAPPGPVLAWKNSGFTICVIRGLARPGRNAA